MDDRRSAIVATAAAIVGAIAAIIAYFKGSQGLFVGLLVVALLLIVLMIVVLLSYVSGWFRGAPASEPPPIPRTAREPVPDKPEALQPGPAFTTLWRHTTNGSEATNVSHSLQKNVHPAGWMGDGYSQRSRVQLSVLVGCAPIPDTLSTTGLVNFYLDFLKSPTIGELVSMLRELDKGVSWQSHWSNGPLNNNAILARTPDSTEAPVAASILNLNAAEIEHPIMFQDNRRAELIVIIDLEEGAERKPFTLAQWHAWMVQALQVAPQFANFLTDKVGVRTYDDPVTVAGVSLQAARDLTELIDTSDLKASPAIQCSSSFPMYLIAGPDGKQPSDVALDALRAVCDYGLHVLGYENQLHDLRRN